MTLGTMRRFTVTAVCALLLLSLNLLAPNGPVAAQTNDATPIAPDSQPTTDDDGEIGAAAVDEAWFDAATYTYDSPVPLTITLNISMAGITTGGTFSIPALALYSWENPAAAVSNSAASCDVTMALDGTLSGTFSNTEIAPATCQISFDVTTDEIVSGTETMTATVDWNNGNTTTAAASIDRSYASGMATSTFGQDTYTAVIGEEFDIAFTFTVDFGGLAGPNPALFGGATIPHPAMLEPYANIQVSTNDPEERADICTAILTGGGEIDFDFDIPSNYPAEAFTCTITFTTSILSTATDGESASMSVRTYIAPGSSGGTATTSIIGYLPSTGSMTLGLSESTAAAGDAVTVTATHTHGSSTESNGIMQVSVPDGSTYETDSASVSCMPTDCTGVSITPSGDSIVATYDGATADTQVTLQLDVTIDDVAMTGSALVFGANGEVGSGPTAQRTGPATATLTISGPMLETAPLSITANPDETLTGTLTGQVSGGVPPYTFSLLDQAGQGTATVNPDGSFTFEANSDAIGSDSFTYEVTDSEPAATDLDAAATVTGVVNVTFSAIAETPTVTATATATASATASSTATSSPEPTATLPGSTDPDQPPALPTQTATPAGDETGGDDASDGEGEDDETGSGGVTSLPSTGTGSSQDGTVMLFALGAALVLLAGSLWTARRKQM